MKVGRGKMELDAFDVTRLIEDVSGKYQEAIDYLSKIIEMSEKQEDTLEFTRRKMEMARKFKEIVKDINDSLEDAEESIRLFKKYLQIKFKRLIKLHIKED